MHFLGMNVVQSPLAREVRTEHRVERHPILKRRRNWRVAVHKIDRPCAYIINGDLMNAAKTVVLHPELYAKLRLEMGLP